MKRDFQNFGNGFLNAPGYGQCFGNCMEQPPKAISRVLCISDPQKPPRRFQIRDTLITISLNKTNATVEPKTTKFKKYELKIQIRKKKKYKKHEKIKYVQAYRHRHTKKLNMNTGTGTRAHIHTRTRRNK